MTLRSVNARRIGVLMFSLCAVGLWSSVTYTEAGASMTGHGADTPMEVFNAGTTELDQLAIFVVDANRPFSSPASLD
jgi:hypothetical protein